MGIDFYYSPGSAPCRSVLLVAKAVGVELNLKMINLKKKEYLTPEFIKINPKCTVPTLVDNDYSLTDYRSILIYLVKKYGKDDTLYPKIPRKRVAIQQKLYFDMDTLYPRFADCYYPTIFSGSDTPDASSMANAKNAFNTLNDSLENHEFVAGDTLTVADLALVATVSTFDVMGFDLAPYEEVSKWFAKVKAIAPGYEEANQKNILIFKQWIDILIAKTR